MLVSILRQGSSLIASIHEALNARAIVQFQQDQVTRSNAVDNHQH